VASGEKTKKQWRVTSNVQEAHSAWNYRMPLAIVETGFSV